MFKFFKNLSQTTQNASPSQKYMEDTIKKTISLKKLVIYGFLANAASLLLIQIYYNKDSYNLSFSRFISRKIGQMMNITIPERFREWIYRKYASFYNVNIDEILESDLKSYKNLKEFFIRKIKMDLRPVDVDNNVISSPCDATVYSFSEIKSPNDLIIVKDIKYNLFDFLFGGPHVYNFNPNFLKFFFENKKYYQLTMYLSPGDCHRYFSPMNMYVSDRIYSPGFLEPVKPKYVEKHPKVFLTNERVTLKTEIDGKTNFGKDMFITFVGALNVGSINLSFDDFVNTNAIYDKDKTGLGDLVLNYSSFFNNNEDLAKSNKELFYYRPSMPLIMKEVLVNESKEFDVRDMVDTDVKISKDELKNSKFNFQQLKEREIYKDLVNKKEDLKFNFFNNFLSYNLDIHKLKQKLQNPKNLKISEFDLSNKGIHFNKKDELGWFNFGSTIVLVFSVENEKEMKCLVELGQKIKIGESLIKVI